MLKLTAVTDEKLWPLNCLNSAVSFQMTFMRDIRVAHVLFKKIKEKNKNLAVGNLNHLICSK